MTKNQCNPKVASKYNTTLQEILKVIFENIALRQRKINQYNTRLCQGRLYVQENGRVRFDEGEHYGEGGGVVQGPLQLLHHPQRVLHEEAAHQASQASG